MNRALLLDAVFWALTLGALVLLISMFVGPLILRATRPMVERDHAGRFKKNAREITRLVGLYNQSTHHGIAAPNFRNALLSAIDDQLALLTLGGWAFLDDALAESYFSHLEVLRQAVNDNNHDKLYLMAARTHSLANQVAVTYFNGGL